MSKSRLFSAASTATIPSWNDLKEKVDATVVGKALNKEKDTRATGRGSSHVHNTLRLFESKSNDSPITLYRDHAGWCPYCQKMMLLVEEKEIPVKISLVNMRSYGDKPNDFLRKVPGGLLPAMEVNGQVITESQVIMELLDEWHQDGYKKMMPETQQDRQRYNQLARLERELFSCWCGLVFRPEMPGSGGNPFAGLLGGGSGISGSMQAFLDCMKRVDDQLQSTSGPWFFDNFDHPTMIDFIYVSHVERMLASCAYWKGLDLRDPKWNFKGLTSWLEAFEKRESYLAFKSDYFTHVMDIPPQYGPGFDGGFADERKTFAADIRGSSDSWHLPLSHDESIQPLYKGPPMPLAVLDAVGIEADKDGSYSSCNEKEMERACRMMAAWKLSGNGSNVAKFASRGGPKGAKNPRKTFGAPLADPYAKSDEEVLSSVDAALRVVCEALQACDTDVSEYVESIKSAVPAQHVNGVRNSLSYLRDRVGVPRDLPLASARYLRAYLNWGIDSL